MTHRRPPGRRPRSSRLYRIAKACRACGNRRLVPVVSLGRQALTGVFPRSSRERVGVGPLELVRCAGPAPKNCGLVQLRHSFDPLAMYGEGYGYRSGLNPSMVRHLKRRVQAVLARIPLRRGDFVVDIGSNDGTLLACYPARGLTLLGVDPTGGRFARYYPKHVRLVPDFFSAEAVERACPGRRAKVVTAFSMFYDLEDPLGFLRQVRRILHPEGILVLEQSYMPTMLARNSYDTICHEHIEYYGLTQVRWLAERAGLRIADVELNDVNGGSFAVVLAPAGPRAARETPAVRRLLASERRLRSSAPFDAFGRRVKRHRGEIRRFIARAKAAGKTIVGYGASTKGNVILQYCGLRARDLTCIAEVNEDKFGVFTPGSLIPIVPESQAHALKPDYMMVLPWHFRKFVVAKERAFRRAGGRLFFPLPRPEVC